MVTYGNPFATSADVYAAGRPYHHERTLRRALSGAATSRAGRPGRAVRTPAGRSGPAARTPAGWPDSALDVACGTGLSTRALAELGIRAAGLDPVPAMVARARADTGLPFAVAAAEALPVADASVDLVTVASGVHWFDQDRFAAEAARVLRPGGTLLLYEHAGASLPDEPAYAGWLRGRTWPASRRRRAARWRARSTAGAGSGSRPRTAGRTRCPSTGPASPPTC